MTKPIIEIELNEVGIGTVKIDGHNIADITRAVTIQTEAGQLTRVTLDLWAHHLKVRLPAGVFARLHEEVGVGDGVAEVSAIGSEWVQYVAAEDAQ